MSLIEELFNIVAPHECLGCQQEGALLCAACGLTMATLPPRCYRCQRLSANFRTCPACRKQTALYAVLAVTVYDGLAKELLHRLKFGRAQAAAGTIADLLAPYCSPLASQIDSITYIPTANTRIRERGYDQARLIARALARRLQVPCLPLLARAGSQRQLGQGRQKRLRQMSGAFWALRPAQLHNQRILLIDDVLTTGATCETAARTLRKAGARRVYAAVFAAAGDPFINRGEAAILSVSAEG
jgi:ComF family protein